MGKVDLEREPSLSEQIEACLEAAQIIEEFDGAQRAVLGCRAAARTLRRLLRHQRGQCEAMYQNDRLTMYCQKEKDHDGEHVDCDGQWAGNVGM